MRMSSKERTNYLPYKAVRRGEHYTQSLLTKIQPVMSDPFLRPKTNLTSGTKFSPFGSPLPLPLLDLAAPRARGQRRGERCGGAAVNDGELLSYIYKLR